MKIKGILFDKDGTLIDFYEVWGNAAEPVTAALLSSLDVLPEKKNKERVLKSLGIEYGIIDEEGPLAWKSYEGIAEDIVSVLEELSGRKIDLKELKEQLAELFFQETIERRKSYPVFTDVKKMLKELSDMGIKTGLATTDGLKSARHCMRTLGAAEEISFWGTADTGLPVKPDSELIYAAAKEWEILPEEIAVVGDTPNDMRFAKSGGAQAIAVLSGTGRKEKMEKYADDLILSVGDLVSLIRKKNGIQK